MNEATRVMSAGGVPPTDRTMVAGVPAAGATQMGMTVACAVCGTANSGIDQYCRECGFLLTSTPGAATEVPPAAGTLLELTDPSSGRRFHLNPGVNSVGRENSDVLLMDGTVSRRHAQVSVDGDAVTVTDLGSTNGTTLEGVPVPANTPTAVAAGATLRFGNSTLVLSIAGEAGEPAPAPADRTIVVSSEEPLPEADVAPSAEPVVGSEAGVSPAAVARLRLTDGPGADIEIRPGSITLGRRAGNDIVLTADPYVSGHHARIDCEAGSVSLTDVGSTNGTQLNGQKLEPNTCQLLMEGDAVQIGQSKYTFEMVEVAEEPATEPLEGEAPPDTSAESAPEAPETEAGTIHEEWWSE